MKNKKSQGATGFLSIFFGILMFSIYSIVVVMIGYLYYAVGNDYTVLPLYNVSQYMNNSALINSGYDSVVTNYQALDLSFIDDMWFLGYAVMVIISFTMAYRIRSINYFSWLSLLTYGIMLLLFVGGLFSILLNFLYSDILLNLFINLAVNTPKLAYYVANFGFILFIHAVSLLLIAQLDFDFSFIINRKKKENQALDTMDDELV